MVSPMAKQRLPETRGFQRIVARAVKEATQVNLRSVGQTYLLYALISYEKTRAAQAIAEQVPLRNIRFNIELTVRRGTFTGKAAISPVAQRVLDDAHREAGEFAMDRVNPVHLLIALTNDEKGAAYQSLTTMKVDIVALRRYLFQHLT